MGPLIRAGKIEKNLKQKYPHYRGYFISMYVCMYVCVYVLLYFVW